MTIAHDETTIPGGPAEAYAELLEALGDEDLAALDEAVAARLAAQGCVFDGHPFRVDPVPRLLGAVEWEDLCAGLTQRVRALDAFVADAHGDRAAVREGVVPARLLEGSEHVDPVAAQ
ncbi:MAG: circularly permuted type 2 ATP-grasp protein, partial [Gemmatimonadetes bacterium]|nr:circularly permuted type 2 ATP-grasp protein [Gemmatimonadota bacterium]